MNDFRVLSQEVLTAYDEFRELERMKQGYLGAMRLSQALLALREALTQAEFDDTCPVTCPKCAYVFPGDTK
jgi:hypothetical protein